MLGYIRFLLFDQNFIYNAWANHLYLYPSQNPSYQLDLCFDCKHLIKSVWVTVDFQKKDLLV